MRWFRRAQCGADFLADNRGSYNKGMSEAQHYLPQAYLRQWCAGDRLLRYRRVGPAGKLEQQRRSPKSVCFRPDLYTLPQGGIANGLTEAMLERFLGARVDNEIRAIVESVSALSGRVIDRSAEQAIIWLLQTFEARDPRTIQRAESGVQQIIETRATPMIARFKERANGAPLPDEILSLADPRRPGVTVRAAIAAVVAKDHPGQAAWLDGDVHVVQASAVRTRLQEIGAGEFVTFDPPVIQWESGSVGLMASFALSPSALVLLFERGKEVTTAAYELAAERHVLVPLKFRDTLISRTEVTGRLLAAAGGLVHSGIGAES